MSLKRLPGSSDRLREAGGAREHSVGPGLPRTTRWGTRLGFERVGDLLRGVVRSGVPCREDRDGCTSPEARRQCPSVEPRRPPAPEIADAARSGGRLTPLRASARGSRDRLSLRTRIAGPNPRSTAATHRRASDCEQRARSTPETKWHVAVCDPREVGACDLAHAGGPRDAGPRKGYGA